MSSIDIEMIWNQQVDLDQQLKLHEIRETTESFSSEQISASRKTVLFDTSYKSVVLIGYIVLLALGVFSIGKLVLTSSVVASLIYLIYRNRLLSSQLHNIDESDPVISVLQQRYNAIMAFYPEYFFSSSIIHPLFVFAGFQFYHLFRYGEDRFNELLSDPVTYLFLLMAFVIPYVTIKMVYSWIIQGMEKLLDPEITESEQEMTIIKLKATERRRNVITGILAFLGLALFLTVILILI